MNPGRDERHLRGRRRRIARRPETRTENRCVKLASVRRTSMWRLLGTCALGATPRSHQSQLALWRDDFLKKHGLGAVRIAQSAERTTAARQELTKTQKDLLKPARRTQRQRRSDRGNGPSLRPNPHPSPPTHNARIGHGGVALKLSPPPSRWAAPRRQGEATFALAEGVRGSPFS